MLTSEESVRRQVQAYDEYRQKLTQIRLLDESRYKDNVTKRVEGGGGVLCDGEAGPEQH